MNKKGFSMVEVLIAAGILGVMVVGIVGLLNNGSFRAQVNKVLAGGACSGEAQAILLQLKAQGFFHVAPNTTTVPLNPVVYDFSTEPPILRPYKNIAGVISTLQAAYLSDVSGFCQNPNGELLYQSNPAISHPLARTFPDLAASSLKNVKKYLKIEPIEVASGHVISDCPLVDVRPLSSLENHLAELIQRPLPFNPTNHPQDPALKVFTLPAARPDVGFKATATISYTDSAQQTQECKAQQNFIYPVYPENLHRLQIQDIETPVNDSNRPEALNNTIVTGALSNPPSQDHLFDSTPPHYLPCSAPAPSPAIGLRLQHVRPGSVMMCRNLSSIRPASFLDVPAGPDGPAGQSMLNMVKQAQTFYSSELMSHPFYGNYPADAIIAGIYYPAGRYFCKRVDGCAGLPYLPQGPDPGGQPAINYYMERGVRYYKPFDASLNTSIHWQPCEKIDVCAAGDDHHYPTTASFVPGEGNTPGAYHLAFNDLPQGCEVHIQMTEVDGGLNMQAIELKEFVQERVPGNKLCWNSATRKSANYPANSFFFACTANNALPTGFADCASLPDPSQACCEDFPTYKEFRPVAPTTVTQPRSCALPWGGSVADSTPVVAYKVGTSADCEGQKQIRFCDDGELVGSFNYQTCVTF